jgi:hypothetical protein
MAEIWYWWGVTRSGSYVTISATGNRIGFNGATFGSSIGVGEFQDSTHVTDDTMSTDFCPSASGHLNNCKYVSPTEINLNSAGTATLTGTVTTGTQCTIKIWFEEDTSDTSVSNVRFYAYDGTTPTSDPTGVSTTSFEWTPSGINTDSINGSGDAWDAANGTNNSANKLIMDSQPTSSGHEFWLGLSASPDSTGLKTSFVYRVELDYQ